MPLLSTFSRATLASGMQLFHGGAFGPGKPLSGITHGMWFSTDSALARQYACFGSAGIPTYLLQVMVLRDLNVILLPNAPLRMLKRHYGDFLPQHAMINRDLATSFKTMGVDGMAFQEEVSHAGDFTEVFLGDVQHNVSVVSHQPS
ncbi:MULTISPECIES: hypothetical protein [Stenotrophomonas]|uniref:hypothetical protein n=1 Tax=Stenotrophomonas TaxID=40323 RepID=UPI0018D48B27|nr:hypothetical protein [Stenotrophomonas sp.]MBH1507031.1 hypothetical protein [Stenotrophomonas maltophilia]